MSSVPAGRFKANAAGFAEMLNMAGVQSACLSQAQAVAAASGLPDVSCDVQAGEKRCHARASWAVPDPKGGQYYRDIYRGTTAAAALQSAAASMGGTVTGVATALSFNKKKGSYNTRKDGSIKKRRKRRRKKK